MNPPLKLLFCLAIFLNTRANRIFHLSILFKYYFLFFLKDSFSYFSLLFLFLSQKILLLINNDSSIERESHCRNWNFLFNFYYYLNYNESTLSSKLHIPHGIKNNFLVQNNEYCCICKSLNTIIVCDSSI